MKRCIGLLLLLALCLGLCACGKGKEAAPEELGSAAVDQASGAWQGEGGCYRTEGLTLPKGAGVQFCRDGQVYSMGYPDMEQTVVYRGGEELIRYAGMALGFCQSEEGIWLMDEERDQNGDTVVLQGYSFDGEPGERLRMQLPQDCFALSLRAAEGLLYLQCSDALRIYDGTGTLCAQIAHEQWAGRLLQGGDGKVYYYEELGKGGVLRAVDAKQGLLRDLGQDLAADGDLNAEDLVLARAIENDCGGLYVMTDSFVIEARIGLKSRFGDAWGWSFEDYYRIDSEMGPGKMTIYNLTAEYFLDNSVSRYLRETIDWQSGTCDFENPDFIRLLEACRNVHETPEDPENMIFGANLMGDGVLATEFVWLDDATDLAQECRRVGQSVSVIGWPTPDGSCGTDFALRNPMGVMKNSKHPELCWAFLKYCLLHADNDIPNYRPLLEAQIEEARHIDPNAERDLWYDGLRSPITEAEVGLLRELLARVEHTTLSDETAMGIVKEEAAPYLAGERGAEETARIIQQRMRIYVAEQG